MHRLNDLAKATKQIMEESDSFFAPFLLILMENTEKSEEATQICDADLPIALTGFQADSEHEEE